MKLAFVLIFVVMGQGLPAVAADSGAPTIMSGGQPTATIIAALIAVAGAYLGSYWGLKTAIRNYRGQKTFDQQFDWYVRMLRSVRTLDGRIVSAFIWMDEGRDDPGWWSQVQIAHEEFERVAWEASLFATATAQAAVDDCLSEVRGAQTDSWTFDPYQIKNSTSWETKAEMQAQLDKAYNAMKALPAKLDARAQPIISEARKHLGLDRDAGWLRAKFNHKRNHILRVPPDALPTHAQPPASDRNLP